MIDGFENHDDLINSVCDGFTIWVNEEVPDDVELLCNQDGYEILVSTFGSEFRKSDVENASIEQVQSIASKLCVYLQKQVTVQDTCNFLNCALRQSFGEYIALSYET